MLRHPAAALLVVAVVFLAAARGALGQNLSSTSDLAGLYSLRASLGLRALDWPRRADPCTRWTGVACDAAGRVVSLNLSGLRRTRLGRLNPQFAIDGLQNLTRIRSFNATGFALPGSIPDWFGRLLPPTLATIDLRLASVSGSIPYSLGSASSLVVLSLAENAITGDIPPTLGQLANLSLLDLSRNSLAGNIPAAFSSLSNLSHLDLSSNFLSGPVPSEFGTLRRLERLILSSNSLTGGIPAQLGGLSSLNTLDLSFNSLVGSLPGDLKSLRGLQDLNLRNNSLSGELTDSLFSGFSLLQSVRLSFNNFSGDLPNSIWSSPKLIILDVSHNNLTGTLPRLTANTTGANGGNVIDLSSNLLYGSIPSGFLVLFGRFSRVDISDNYYYGAFPEGNGGKIVSFQFNCFRNSTDQRSPDVCEEFYAQRGLQYDGVLTPPTPPSSSKKSHRLTYILIGAIAGGVLLLVVLVLLGCCIYRSRGRDTDETEISRVAAPSGGGAPAPGASVNLTAVGLAFSYEQLVRATADFSQANLIKHGHSGDIFRGTLEGGVLVVIKRMNMQKLRKDAHLAELDFFSRALHERLVPFLGHCLDHENEKFLVYKYVPNGDLSVALHYKPGQEEEGLQSLDWIKRLKIATGVAEALYYLHHECNPPFVHRDVQASSILLDDKFEIRLGSLSDVSTQEGEGHHNVITRLLRFSQTSEQSVSGPPAACAYDVYCFGKVLLKLITGKLGLSSSNDLATNEWLGRTLPYIDMYDKELVTKIVDPFLVVDEDHLEEVWAMAIVARSCLHTKPSRRPPMKHILKALENPLKVVREDNNAGSGRLKTTSSRGSWNAAFMGSWRRSSSDVGNVAGQPRDEQTLKRSGTSRSQGSPGEHSFSHRRPSNEIFPEPSSGANEDEE